MFLCSTCSSGGRSQVQTFQALPFFARFFLCQKSVLVYRFLTPLTRKGSITRSSTVPKIKKRREEYFSRKMVPWPKLERKAAFFFSRKKRSHIKQSKCKLQTPLSLIKCESQKTASLLVGANATAIAFFKQSKEKPLASPYSDGGQGSRRL